MFGLTDEELSALSEEELDTLNAKTLFIRDAMPGSWLEIAGELQHAAELVWSESNNKVAVEAVFQGSEDGQPRLVELKRYSPLLRVWVLLAGYAVENLVKGLLVAQNPDHISSGKLKNIGQHGIVRLAHQLEGISLSEKEHRVCEVFDEAIPYWGRYPIPKDFRRLTAHMVPDSTFRQIYLDLCERLEATLHELVKDGWDSGVGPAMLKSQDANDIDLTEPFPWTEEE